MIRALVLYAQAPDPDRYRAHAELCRRVEGGTFRHGPVFGAPGGEPQHRYYAEWEFPDRDAFRAAARTPEFAATGKDAAELGVPFVVEFAELEG
jgi:hypothetical protein